MLKSFTQFAKIVRDNAVANSVALHKEFTVDMGQSFAIDTPVDTGRATANWKAGVNSMPIGSSTEFDTSSTAKRTADIMRSDLSSIRLGDEAVVRNAVEDGSEDGSGYIIDLENGLSSQAPLGMFAINVVKSKQIIKKTKKSLGL